jgi:L-cysteine desulfidase
MDTNDQKYGNYLRILREELVPAAGCIEPAVEAAEQEHIGRSRLTVEDIISFAETVKLEDVCEIIERQIALNSAVSAEGLTGRYGANTGAVLTRSYGNDIKGRAKAAAAAGADAWMSGCGLPVVTVSGSGTQGMTASLPVIEYAKDLGSDRECLIRALVVSNLITIHLKTGIGRLSAYCGVVSAGAGAASGIAYLLGGRMEEIAHTIVNALAIDSGIVCDGAKPSCAAKIAAAVDTGILGYEMYKNGQQFYAGDGIIAKGVENTIRNINRLGKEGMRETDKEIIRIMLDE